MKTFQNKTEEVEFTRVNRDINGNPRYVCHFLNLINEGDRAKAKTSSDFIGYEYAIALNKARKIGGRKYHNKSYGGGIVFQSYNIANLRESVNKAKEGNTNFIQEWKDFPKQERKVKRAIFSYFSNHKHTYIDNHDQPAKPLHTGRHPECRFKSFDDLDMLLGFAYTSSGAYAGLWICNGVELKADETHSFIGFAINTDGEVIGIAQDAEENEIFIEL